MIGDYGRDNQGLLWQVEKSLTFKDCAGLSVRLATVGEEGETKYLVPVPHINHSLSKMLVLGEIYMWHVDA